MLDDALKSPQGLEKLLESHVIALSASNQFSLDHRRVYGRKLQVYSRELPFKW